MKAKISWKNLYVMVLWSIVVGFANFWFFATLVNPWNTAVKSDEVAANTFTLNFFVVWALFTVWFLARADEEWKKTAEAVDQHKLDQFLLEAPKRIAFSVRVLYVIISLVVVVSFYLFHIESLFAKSVIQGGVGFIIALALQFLWDLDDPITGAINVSGIPNEWIEKLKKKK